MTRDLLLLVFCGALGFACAGVGGSFYRLITSSPPSFSLRSKSWASAFFSFLFFALAGPFILAQLIWRRRAGGDPILVSVGGLTVALLWSVCTGVVVLDFALSMKHGFV